MKRKLIKYELMATARLYLPLFLVMAVSALLGRLSLWQMPWVVVSEPQRFSVGASIGRSDAMGQLLGTLATFVIFFYILVMLGALVVHFIITLQRFWKSLLGDEGYLMFTLPVTAGDLLWAKAVSAFLWSIATVLMIAAAILILLWHPRMVSAIRYQLAQIPPDSWGLIHQMLRSIFPPVLRPVLVIEFFVNGFGGLFLLYAAMAMGHTVRRHKVLAALASYTAITMVIGTVVSLLMGALFPILASGVSELELFMSTPELLLFARQMGDFLTGVWSFVLIADLATAVGTFLLARHLLTTQLNLE